MSTVVSVSLLVFVPGWLANITYLCIKCYGESRKSKKAEESREQKVSLNQLTLNKQTNTKTQKQKSQQIQQMHM
jgi:Sec-independent protein translocase protein TatA